MSHLSFYDIAHVKGVAAYFSHIETRAQGTAHDGLSRLADCLKDANIMLIPEGVPRKPGMTWDDLINTSAPIVEQLTHACALHCPKAIICTTNPVNSTAPIAAETLKTNGSYGPHRLFGVTKLEVVRSNTFIADAKKIDVRKVFVRSLEAFPALQLCLSFYSSFTVSFPREERQKLKTPIHKSVTKAVEAKAGTGSATLSMVYSVVRFATSLMEAMSGHAGIVACAFVQSDVSKCKFFATPITLDPKGVERNMDIGKLSKFEIELLNVVMFEVEKNIKRDKKFTTTFKPT
ncbi:malate dehydrogenase [Fasciola hepatica]|uniref:Malate dehydrogenase, mitochondrial n=1 Tax=Fasciola hepatica TaxID=6192 RepID=A0A4E0RPS4_FASHE|nr:malate dehydrogenase [Fasciola hepatica]